MILQITGKPFQDYQIVLRDVKILLSHPLHAYIKFYFSTECKRRSHWVSNILLPKDFNEPAEILFCFDSKRSCEENLIVFSQVRQEY